MNLNMAPTPCHQGVLINKKATVTVTNTISIFSYCDFELPGSSDWSSFVKGEQGFMYVKTCGLVSNDMALVEVLEFAEICGGGDDDLALPALLCLNSKTLGKQPTVHCCLGSLPQPRVIEPALFRAVCITQESEMQQAFSILEGGHYAKPREPD